MELINRGKLFFKSSIVERFFFSVLCATAFTACMCHWLLDIVYRYYWLEQPGILVDYHWVFAVGATVCLYYLIRLQKIPFDFRFLLLCQTFIFIEILDYNREHYTSLAYAWIVPTAFFAGRLVILNSRNDRTEASKRAAISYFVIAAGSFCASAPDFYNNFRLAPVMGFQTEGWPSFWLNTLIENRCTYELGFVLTTGAIGYALYKIKKHPVICLITVAANVYLQYVVTVSTGRENRVLLPVSIVFFVVIFVWEEWNNPSKKIRFLTRALPIAVVFTIVLLILAYIFNWFGLYDRYQISYMAVSGGILGNERFSMDYGGFMSMLKYPLENYRGYPGTTRPHSMILEYGREFGFSVFVLLTIFRLLIIKDAVVMFFIRNEYSWVKYLLLPGFVNVNLYYSMEPNGHAHRDFWMLGLFLSGIIRGWLEIQHIDKTSKKEGTKCLNLLRE